MKRLHWTGEYLTIEGMDDCKLRDMALKAFEYARWNFDNSRRELTTEDFAVVEAEGYHCLVHVTDWGKSNGTVSSIGIEFEDSVEPFDEDRLYPGQCLEVKLSFKRFY